MTSGSSHSGILAAGLFAFALSPGVPAHAGEAEQAIACDTLIALRLSMAGGGEQAITGRPDCRMVVRTDIGAVEQRAMVGGAPFECLAVRDVPHCLWIRP